MSECATPLYTFGSAQVVFSRENDATAPRYERVQDDVESSQVRAMEPPPHHARAKR